MGCVVKRKKRLPEGVTLVDAKDVFESTVVELCKEARCHRRFSPSDIDVIVVELVAEFATTLEEFSIFLEREDWDGLCALAAQERTMEMLRGRR